MGTDALGGGNVEPRALEDEMRTAYLDYAMSVIVGRALPDVRDGLKPVHRRVLHGMNELGLQPTRSYSKCAKIVGEVMGNFHPHGDSAIYDTLVRMAQDFSLRYPLVDGQGNFGSVDDDPAAAMRYCVTGETRVATSLGSIRIDDLAAGMEPDSERGLGLEVLDRLGRPVTASTLFHSGGHETLRLRTKEGFELTGTHNHPVLCLVDMVGVPLLFWKLLEELVPGDRVAMFRPAMTRAMPSQPQLRSEPRFSDDAVVALVERAAVAIEHELTGESHYYATVTSVEPAGVQPVYSLRVETDDHSFLTDGFVSHNTEARLDRMATEMLRDLDMDTVDFVPNYDGSRQEPVVMPSRFPNLLVNGSSGIAVGMATNIPPHNLQEVVDAVIAYLRDPDITTEGLMHHVKGPDFPTGGIIMGRQGIRDAYETGRGRVRVRARVGVEDIGQGKEALIVTELPFMVKKGGDGGLITKIADLVHEKKIPEISDLRDESDRRGMRLVIELKRNVIPKVVLNKLYKHTSMQTTFGVNMVALVDGVPRTLSLLEVISAYVSHQREVIVRRAKFELAQKEARAHVLEGLLIALDNLDAIIDMIRKSPNREAAREQLVANFGLSVIQATAILDLRLSQLTALESDAIKQEHADVTERIRELRELLGDENNVRELIIEELSEIAERFADDRRTELAQSEDEVSIEDLIQDQQMVITITKTGYIKSLPLATYRKQHRGGVGVTGMDMKDGDFIEHLFVCSSHDFLLFFSNRGKIYRSKVYDLPEAQRTAKGRALVNVLPLRDNERIQSVLSTRDFGESRYLVFATKTGTVKKTEFKAYNTPIKADGIIAIKIREDDELVAVRRVDPGDEILMVSKAGLAVRFPEDATRAMGRDTSGVRGMNITGKGNEVLSMDIARDEQEMLVVTENGFGKRTPIDQYRKTSRGAKGVQTIKFSEARGGLAAALVVRPHQELLFISQEGMVQRTGVKGIRQTGRSAQGVKVMNVREDDRLSAVALVVESDAETAAPVADDMLGDNGVPGFEPADLADDVADGSLADDTEE